MHQDGHREAALGSIEPQWSDLLNACRFGAKDRRSQGTKRDTVGETLGQYQNFSTPLVAEGRRVENK